MVVLAESGNARTGTTSMGLDEFDVLLTGFKATLLNVVVRELAGDCMAALIACPKRRHESAVESIMISSVHDSPR